MLITEVLPKVQVSSVSGARLAIPGYKVYLSFIPDALCLSTARPRGICIYVRDSLPCSEVMFLASPFREQLWVNIRLAGSDILLIGCIYRSPSNSLE